PTTAVHLSEHLSQAVLRGRCVPHHGLVGPREGVGRISQSIHSSINSIVEPVSVRLVRVPFLDLETLVPSDSRIALMKCDIEGAEELFISSYPELLKRVDLAVFEFHDQLCDVENCRALLHAAGLRTRRLLRVFGVGITIELFER